MGKMSRSFLEARAGSDEKRRKWQRDDDEQLGVMTFSSLTGTMSPS
jgi:hypothetical protein